MKVIPEDAKDLYEKDNKPGVFSPDPFYKCINIFKGRNTSVGQNDFGHISIPNRWNSASRKTYTF